MPNRQLEDFLTLLSTRLQLNESQRLEITQELVDYFELKVKNLINTELSPVEAAKIALEEFGDVASMASRFNEVERIRHRNFMVGTHPTARNGEF